LFFKNKKDKTGQRGAQNGLEGGKKKRKGGGGGLRGESKGYGCRGTY